MTTGIRAWLALAVTEPLSMPAATGSSKTFTAPRNDGVDETLTVTVK